LNLTTIPWRNGFQNIKIQQYSNFSAKADDQEEDQLVLLKLLFFAKENLPPHECRYKLN
jgi:hypothetical protein